MAVPPARALLEALRHALPRSSEDGSPKITGPTTLLQRVSLVADGLGFCANSLELGCDCVGNILYFDALMNDSKGKIATQWSRLAIRLKDTP